MGLLYQINWRRGAFRAWLVVSLLWATAIGIVGFTVFEKGFTRNSPGIVYVKSPWNLNDVYDFPADWDFDKISYALAGFYSKDKPPSAPASCDKKPDKGEMPLEWPDVIFVDKENLVRAPLLPSKSNFLFWAAAMFLPPLVLLLLTCMLWWVISGFRKPV